MKTMWLSLKYLSSLLSFAMIIIPTSPLYAAVPVRISIKFIVDVNGNRPATGNLNTDPEIQNEVTEGTRILQGAITEFNLDQVELVDLPNVSQWYTSDANNTNRDNLRTAATNNPALYLWRTNAINIYINGGPGAAVSAFPPNNNIILVNQGCGNTPSCILHELGHSLNLMHTHETCCTNGDECADTLPDNQNWTKDQIAQNNFGTTFANLTPAQQDQVNMTYNNVMSYHVDEPQRRLSPCQMNRISTQGYTDRNWLLTKIPVYVNNGYGGSSQTGSFSTPYKTFQGAWTPGGSRTGSWSLSRAITPRPSRS